MPLRLRRGTDAERLTITPEEGEPIYVTDTKKLFIGDGSTVGGTDPLALVKLSEVTVDTDTNLNGYNLIADSTVLYDSATGTLSAESLVGNVAGSVIGNDSTVLVDATNNSINLNNTIKDDITPDSDSTHDLGSNTKRFKDLYLGGDSLWLGGVQITSDGTKINLPAGSTIGGLTLGTGGEILPGNSLNVSIVGDDSTTIVDASNNSIAITDIDSVNGLINIGAENFPASVVLNLDENLKTRQAIAPGSIRGYLTSELSRGTIDNPATLVQGDDLGGILIKGYNGASYAIGGIISFFVDPTSSVTPGGNFIKSQVAINASTDTSQNESDSLILDSAGVVTSNAFVANQYLQVPVYNNDTERDDAITSPVAGMIIFNARDDSTYIPSFQGYNGDEWLEGLYGADSTVNFLSGTITGDLIPDTDVAYDLGSASKRFRDLYLSGSTIDLGGTTLSIVGGELRLGGVKIPTATDLAGGSITVNPTGDLEGSVFGDDSVLLVDGVKSQIVGPINTQTDIELNNNNIEGLNAINSELGVHSILMNDQTAMAIGSSSGIIITGGASANIEIGNATSGNVTLGSGTNTVDFASGTTVDFANATVQNVLPSRTTVSATTTSIADGADEDVDVTGFKGYALLNIETDAAAWVRVYTSAAARTADNSRLETTDPAPDAGVIAEVITTGAQSVRISPGVFGYNDESPVNTTVYVNITNKSGSTQTVTADLTILQLEG